MLSDDEAREVLARFPDLDGITECYRGGGPGCLCSQHDETLFGSQSGHRLEGHPPAQPLPEWLVQAREERQRALTALGREEPAELVAEFAELAVELAQPAPPPPPGEWQVPHHPMLSHPHVRAQAHPMLSQPDTRRRIGLVPDPRSPRARWCRAWPR